LRDFRRTIIHVWHSIDRPPTPNHHQTTARESVLLLVVLVLHHSSILLACTSYIEIQLFYVPKYRSTVNISISGRGRWPRRRRRRRRRRSLLILLTHFDFKNSDDDDDNDDDDDDDDGGMPGGSLRLPSLPTQHTVAQDQRNCIVSAVVF